MNELLGLTFAFPEPAQDALIDALCFDAIRLCPGLCACVRERGEESQIGLDDIHLDIVPVDMIVSGRGGDPLLKSVGTRAEGVFFQRVRLRHDCQHDISTSSLPIINVRTLARLRLVSRSFCRKVSCSSAWLIAQMQSDHAREWCKQPHNRNRWSSLSRSMSDNPNVDILHPDQQWGNRRMIDVVPMMFATLHPLVGLDQVPPIDLTSRDGIDLLRTLAPNHLAFVAEICAVVGIDRALIRRRQRTSLPNHDFHDVFFGAAEGESNRRRLRRFDCRWQRRWRFLGAHRVGAFDRQTVWIFHMFCFETNRYIFNVFVAYRTRVVGAGCIVGVGEEYMPKGSDVPMLKLEVLQEPRTRKQKVRVRFNFNNLTTTTKMSGSSSSAPAPTPASSFSTDLVPTISPEDAERFRNVGILCASAGDVEHVGLGMLLGPPLSETTPWSHVVTAAHVAYDAVVVENTQFVFQFLNLSIAARPRLCIGTPLSKTFDSFEHDMAICRIGAQASTYGGADPFLDSCDFDESVAVVDSSVPEISYVLHTMDPMSLTKAAEMLKTGSEVSLLDYNASDRIFRSKSLRVENVKVCQGEPTGFLKMRLVSDLLVVLSGSVNNGSSGGPVYCGDTFIGIVVACKDQKTFVAWPGTVLHRTVAALGKLSWTDAFRSFVPDLDGISLYVFGSTNATERYQIPNDVRQALDDRSRVAFSSVQHFARAAISDKADIYDMRKVIDLTDIDCAYWYIRKAKDKSRGTLGFSVCTAFDRQNDQHIMIHGHCSVEWPTSGRNRKVLLKIVRLNARHAKVSEPQNWLEDQDHGVEEAKNRGLTPSNIPSWCPQNPPADVKDGLAPFQNWLVKCLNSSPWISKSHLYHLLVVAHRERDRDSPKGLKRIHACRRIYKGDWRAYDSRRSISHYIKSQLGGAEFTY
jgi:hypothetical protein